MTAPVDQRYVIVGALGRSDVAATYAARVSGAPEIDRWVVLKFPRREVLPTARDAQAFLTECQRLARLSHDQLVPIVDAGVYGEDEVAAHPDLAEALGPGPAPFVATPYLPGETLTGLLESMSARGRLMVAELAAYLMAQVCDALDYAHGGPAREGPASELRPTGVVHGNLGPQNVLITYAGTVKTLDLGLERALGLDRVRFAPTVRALGFTSPERARGEDPSHASDLFAVGVLLWESVAGQPLFRARDVPHAMQLVRDCYVPALREVAPDIPPDFGAIVGRALARDRDSRYTSAYELGRDLRRFTASRGAALSPAEMARIMSDLFGARSLELDPLARIGATAKPTARTERPRPPASRRSLSLSGRPVPLRDEPPTEDVETLPARPALRAGPDAWAAAAARHDAADARNVGAHAAEALGTPLPDLVEYARLQEASRRSTPSPAMILDSGLQDPSRVHQPEIVGEGGAPGRPQALLPPTLGPALSPPPIEPPPPSLDLGALPALPAPPSAPLALPAPAPTAAPAPALAPAEERALVLAKPAPSGSWRVGGAAAGVPSFDLADLRRPRSPLPSDAPEHHPTEAPPASAMASAAWPRAEADPRPWWMSVPAVLGLICMVAATALIAFVGHKQAEPRTEALPEPPLEARAALHPTPAVTPTPPAPTPVPTELAASAPDAGPGPDAAAAPAPIASPAPTAATREASAPDAGQAPPAPAPSPSATAPAPTAPSPSGPAATAAAPGTSPSPTAVPPDDDEETEGEAIAIGESLAEDGRRALIAGELAKAEKLLDDCVQFGGPTTCLRDLGAVHERRGHTDSARAAYRAYLDREPSAPDRATIEARIAALGS